jgi:hypothetical protein
MICDTLIRLTRLCYRNHPNFPTSLHPPRAYTEESAPFSDGHIAKGRVIRRRRKSCIVVGRISFHIIHRERTKRDEEQAVWK